MEKFNIPVYVRSDFVAFSDSQNQGLYINKTKTDFYCVKAALAIELPEEKITITKEEFDLTVSQIIDNKDWYFPPELRNKLFEKYGNKGTER